MKPLEQIITSIGLYATKTTTRFGLYMIRFERHRELLSIIRSNHHGNPSVWIGGRDDKLLVDREMWERIKIEVEKILNNETD